MDQVGILDTLGKVFEGAILRTVQVRDEPPGFIEMQVLKRRASKLAAEFKRRLQHPATKPDDVEADIRLRVAISGFENALTNEQWNELQQLLMDESGMTELKEQQLNRAGRRVG